MTLKLNSRVVSVDAQEGKVTLESGEIISNSADLIIGADSIKCIVRDAVARGPPTPPAPTGHAAYRAVISTKDMIDFRSHAQATRRPDRNDHLDGTWQAHHTSLMCPLQTRCINDRDAARKGRV
jgi:2-polyprenyl-6-methoxyphenol hydroxylase-like FAD-dependent oxidoreductase